MLRIMKTIPDTKFYFAKASVNRALDAGELAEIAAEAGIAGEPCGSVREAWLAALSATNRDVYLSAVPILWLPISLPASADGLQ